MKRRNRAEPRDQEQMVTRVRREDVAGARAWLKSRRDPTLDDDAVDAMTPLVLFRRLVNFVRSESA